MEQLLDNKYIFWVITGLWGGMLSLVIYLLKRQMEAQTKITEQLRTDCQKNNEKINEIIANLPIQYTLRDEFLRVTTDQNRKLDKIWDTLGEQSQSLAAIMAAIKGVGKCDQ